MSFNAEIKSFIAAYGAGKKMFDNSDRDYKQAKTALIKEQIGLLQDPETKRSRSLINESRALMNVGRKNANDFQRLMIDDFKKNGGPGGDVTGDYDKTMGGAGAPPATPKPQSALPVTPQGNQVAQDEGDDEPQDTQMAGNTQADEPDDEQPTQFAASGGAIERPAVSTDGQRQRDQRQDYSEDAAKVTAGAGALPVPEYLGAIERMHKTRAKNYAGGGTVEDDETTDDSMDAAPNETDGGEGGDEGQGEGALPLSASPTAGRTPSGGASGFDPEASHDAVFAGQLAAMKRFGLNRSVGVHSPDRQGRVRAYAMGGGAVDPKLFQHVSKLVDPDGSLPEGERNMKAIGSIWQYYIKKHDLRSAQTAAGEMVQYFRGASQRYASLAAAAAKGGHTDAAGQLLAKAYANIPDGRDFRIVSNEQQGPGIAPENRGGGISAEYLDENGKVIRKGILTPEELAQDAMKLASPTTFDQLVEMAGKPLKPGKPAPAPKGASVPKLADRAKSEEMIGDTAEGSTKAVAAALLRANDLDSSRANKIATVLLDPKASTKLQPNQDGSYTAIFDGGQQIKIPQMAFLEMMDVRGRATDTNKADEEKTAAHTAARKDVQDREDAAIKKVRDKTYTPERVSAARNPGKFMARKQREENPDQRELATADEE